METPSGDAGIYARESSYLERFVQVGTAGEKVIAVSFPTEPADGSEETHPLLDRIDDYLNGSNDEFDDVAVGLTVPTDQRAILERVREIPYGEDATVEQIAGMTPGLNGTEQDDLTEVREALAANPVPLIIPDHRVRDGPSATPPAVEQKLRSVESL